MPQNEDPSDFHLDIELSQFFWLKKGFLLVLPYLALYSKKLYLQMGYKFSES
jgi:hypothetical protein